ncbi:MAG: cinA 1 [Frankiales bacterium]|nr:cinA 1 [Frankiales bacterium]
MTTVDHLPGFDTDLDHHGPEFREHNYALMRELQQTCPVAKSSAWGGIWIFTSYDAVFDAVQDPGLFSNHMDKGIPSGGYVDPLIPIDIDPPLLRDYRNLLLPLLSPKAARAQEQELRDLATELIDAVIESGTADLAQDLFTPLPARWILRFLSFDETHWREWIGWIHSMIHGRSTNPEQSQRDVQSLYGAIVAEVQKRRDHPSGDVLSTLMAAEVGGRKMSDGELIGIVMLLLLGGMDTTAGLTGNAFLRIDADPALRRRLTEDPTALDQATEEFLRHDTPTQGLSRIVTRDAEFHGRQLKKGDRVMLMFAAANRDPAVFADPEELDVDRQANRHMAFALGVHRCLGSNFARLMFKVMITEVLRRLPDATDAGDIRRYPDSGDVYAVEHLPVRFTSGAPEAR